MDIYNNFRPINRKGRLNQSPTPIARNRLSGYLMDLQELKNQVNPVILSNKYLGSYKGRWDVFYQVWEGKWGKLYGVKDNVFWLSLVDFHWKIAASSTRNSKLETRRSIAEIPSLTKGKRGKIKVLSVYCPVSSIKFQVSRIDLIKNFSNWNSAGAENPKSFS